jgi:hypothetical protein
MLSFAGTILMLCVISFCCGKGPTLGTGAHAIIPGDTVLGVPPTTTIEKIPRKVLEDAKKLILYQF